MNKFKKAFIFSIIFSIIFICISIVAIGYEIVLNMLKADFMFDVFIIWFISFCIGVMIAEDLESL